MDWRIFAVLAAVCMYDGYSRNAADTAEKAANKADGLALEDGMVSDKQLSSPFAKHPNNHMHIQYCAS